MTENLKKLIGLLNHLDFPFYIERNDFERGGISINEEIADLRSENHVSPEEAEEMLCSETIWSIRFYFGPSKMDYKIVYSATFETAVNQILTKLEWFI